MKQVSLACLSYVQDYDETFPVERMPNTYNPPAPNGVTWRTVVQPYIKNTQVMFCPEDTRNVAWSEGYMDDQLYACSGQNGRRNHISYAYNGYELNNGSGTKLAVISASANVIMLIESRMEYPDLGLWVFPWDLSGAFGLKGAGPFTTHNSMCNWSFMDGHVKTLKLAATIKPWLWSEPADPLHPDGGDQNVVQRSLDGIANGPNTEYQ